jgi:hypothetical protein
MRVRYEWSGAAELEMANYNLFTSKYVYIAWLYGLMKHKSA